MRRFSILFVGLIFLNWSGVANAGYLFLRIDMATQVDTSKVEDVGIECGVYDVHRRAVGTGRRRISLNSDGSYYGQISVRIEPFVGVSGDADMLANATDYKCRYYVLKPGAGGYLHPLEQESDIPDGLVFYPGGTRPFRPTVSGRVRW